MMTLRRKIIGLCIVAVFAVAIVLGGVHSAISVIEATSDAANPDTGDYVARLDTAGDEDPALASLKYVCLFH